MSLIKALRENIEININLLNKAGLRVGKVVFIEESSGIRIKNFENIGHKLLMIIRPTECTQEIPWPIVVNDKKKHDEFLRKFCSFIKMLNSGSQVCLPIISPSALREAKGENILRLLYKLTTLALETQLKNMMGSEEKNMLLPKPLSSKEDNINKIKTNMVKGAICEENATLMKVSQYKESAQITLENLQSMNNKIEEEITVEKGNLASSIEELEVSSDVKNKLCDLEDTSTISDYNNEVQSKEEELKKNCKQIVQIRDLASADLKLANREEFCLDGQDIIKANYKKNNLAPPMSENGDVRLIEVMTSFKDEVLEKVGSCWDVESLGEKPIYKEAQELRSVATKNQKESTKILNVLCNIMEDNKQAESKLRKIQSKRMKDKKLPEYIQLLKAVDSRSLNINLPTSSANDSNLSVVTVKKRRSLNTVIHRKKNGPAVVCSYKNKQSQRKHYEGLNNSSHFQKSLKKRDSLTLIEVPGGSVQKTPKFKLPLAASTYVSNQQDTSSVVLADPQPGTSSMGAKPQATTTASSAAAGNRVSTATRRSARFKVPGGSLQKTPKFKLPLAASTPLAVSNQQDPSSLVLADPQPGTSSMGAKPQATTTASSAAAGNRVSTATRRSAQFKSLTLKKANEESSLPQTSIQEPCNMNPVTERRSNRKSLDDIIKRYFALKKTMANQPQQSLEQENGADSE